MKQLRVALILALVAAFAAACGGSGGARSVPDDAVAVVGDATLTKDQYNHILGQVRRSYAAQKRPFPKAGTQQFSQLQATVIQFLVERSEYDQEAKKLDVKVTDKEIDDRLDQVKRQFFTQAKSRAEIEKLYRRQLKTLGFTDQDVRASIRASLLRDKIYDKVLKDVKVSDDDAKKYYDSHKDQYRQPETPESRDVRHILVKSHAKALMIYGRLKSGADFAKLALKYSVDPSKTNGGRLTVCKEQSVSCLKTVASFERTAFALKTNQISKPVHTRYGWHVIQALGPARPRKGPSTVPFDQVKAAIKQMLLQQKKQEESTKWWNDTKKDFAKKIAYQTGYAPPATSTTQTDTTR
jgi:foldase protein PrsA